MARIVVVSPGRQILMVRYEDEQPMDPARRGPLAYWVPPGGALRQGETFEEAANRELEEETGIKVSVNAPHVFTRELELYFGRGLALCHERYFVVWLQEKPHALRNRTHEAIKAFRWWSTEAMRESSEAFFPEGFLELAEQILSGQLGSEQGVKADERSKQ